MTRNRRLALALLLVVVAALKFAHASFLAEPDRHGAYYTDVARHVRDGDGVSTSLSLVHQGFETFPHPSPASPLWPFVLGSVSRVIPLRSAGAVLGTACWLAAIAFAYLWGRRLAGAGHVLAALVALDCAFFRETSNRGAEGICVAILFAGLWWFQPRWKSLRLGDGFVMGAWLGALALASSDLAFVGVAVILTLAAMIILLPDRGSRMEAAAACASTFVAAITPQVLRLSAWTEGSAWSALFRFDGARERSVLAPLQGTTHLASLGSMCAVLALFGAFVFLAHHRMPVARSLSTALVASVLAASVLAVAGALACDLRHERRSYDALISTLQAAAPVTVALDGAHAERIAWRTEGVGFHGIYRESSARDAAALGRLGVQWAVFDPNETAAWPSRAFFESEGSGWRRANDIGGFELFERAGEPTP